MISPVLLLLMGYMMYQSLDIYPFFDECHPRSMRQDKLPGVSSIAISI